MMTTLPPQERKIDMSPEAIDRRLREVAQLYRLGVEIRSARRLGKITDRNKAARDHHRVTHKTDIHLS